MIGYLVSNNPDTSEDEALEPPVDSPGGPAGDFSAGGCKQLLGRGGREVGIDVGGGGPAGGSEQEVAGEVEQASGGITHEEFCRNSRADLFQGPVDECVVRKWSM
jgi:hypothetical protein